MKSKYRSLNTKNRDKKISTPLQLQDDQKMITTIIFDLSEVYLHGFLGFDQLLNKRYGTKITQKDLFIQELELLFCGKISEEDYWKTLISKFSLSASAADLEKIVRGNFTEIRGVRKIIEDLKSNNYKLGLLSIHAKEWILYCETRFQYHKLFDHAVYSFDTKYSKPDIRSYKLIMDKFKAKSNECLFIDDSDKNLISAKKIGMATIKFKTARQLRKELRSIKINI